MGRRVVAVLDDRPERFGEDFCGVPISGPVSERIAEMAGVEVFLAMGDNRARARLAAAIQLPYATLIHPFSWIAPDVWIAEGTLVCAGAVVQPGATIGRHCIINTSSSVDHDCVIEDFVHISPGAHLAGAVTAREGTHVGIGASVIQTLEVGQWATLGAGAAVIRDVPPNSVVKGVPAL